MKAKIICMVSAKGGTGKTVVAASLGTFLAGIGKKVLLIDMDAATNGLTLFFLKELIDNKKRISKNKSKNAYGIFEISGDIHPLFFDIAHNLDFVPTTYVLKREIATDKIDENAISNTIKSFQNNYDFIILDAQAGTDGLFAMEKSDEIIIVTEYDPISSEGVDRLRRLYPEVLTHDKTWILINKVLPEFHKSLGDFLSPFRFLSPIPWDAEVVRAYTRRKLAIEMKKGNEYTIAIMQIALSLLDTEIEDDVNKWREKTEESLRKPTKDKLTEIKQQILDIEGDIIDTQWRLRDQKIRLYFGFAIAIVMSIAGFYSLIVIADTSSNDFGFFSILFGLMFLPGIPLIFYLMYRLKFSKMMRNSQEKTKLRLRILEEELEDLKDTKAKFSVISDSDIVQLIRNKKYK